MNADDERFYQRQNNPELAKHYMDGYRIGEASINLQLYFSRYSKSRLTAQTFMAFFLGALTCLLMT